MALGEESDGDDGDTAGLVDGDTDELGEGDADGDMDGLEDGDGAGDTDGLGDGDGAVTVKLAEVVKTLLPFRAIM